MAGFLLNSKLLEFNREMKREKPWTKFIATKFSSPYACIFMNQLDTKFFTSQYLQPFLWLCYLNNMIFIGESWKKIV